MMTMGAVSTTPAIARGAEHRHLPGRNVGLDLVVGTGEGVAPAAARRPDPDDLSGADRFGVGEDLDLALVGPARVDGDLERSPGAAAVDAPARQDRPV
jgi:hypothetical protein